VGSLIRLLFPMQLLRPMLRPITRFLVGLIAIPLFRLFLRKVVRLQELDEELEKDMEEWFRGSLLLLAASANMEIVLFDWVPLDLQGEYAWLSVGLRLLLAIGVVEAMPDQELFSVIHPGPPPFEWPKKKRRWQTLRKQIWPYTKGIVCQHINRSSPVLAIMAAIFGGDRTNPAEYHSWAVGWVCYVLAISQYLLIGLVTSRDKARDAMERFDIQVALKRKQFVQEFGIDESDNDTSQPHKTASASG